MVKDSNPFGEFMTLLDLLQGSIRMKAIMMLATKGNRGVVESLGVATKNGGEFIAGWCPRGSLHGHTPFSLYCKFEA